MSDPAAHDFASDNHAGAHPAVVAAIAAANSGHSPSYGADPETERARELVRKHLGPDADAHLVFNGTGANVAALDAITGPGEAVVCTDVAHMHVDECGAPERHAEVKLLTVAAADGRLAASDLARFETRRGDQHSVQPRVVSLTQASELGTVYEPASVREIADAAHAAGMLVHMDGARLANAAAFLGASLRELTTDAGVDVLSLGATKNGALVCDAVVFLRPGLGERFAYVRKQQSQLGSKGRFLGAQLAALLDGDLWLENARNANEMAARLAAAVAPIAGVEIVYPVESNAVFARMSHGALERLRSAHPFYIWDDAAGIARWMCSWDTRPEHVDEFAAAVASAAGEAG